MQHATEGVHLTLESGISINRLDLFDILGIITLIIIGILCFKYNHIILGIIGINKYIYSTFIEMIIMDDKSA